MLVLHLLSDSSGQVRSWHAKAAFEVACALMWPMHFWLHVPSAEQVNQLLKQPSLCCVQHFMQVLVGDARPSVPVEELEVPGDALLGQNCLQ